jgi:hypothetical protein
MLVLIYLMFHHKLPVITKISTLSMINSYSNANKFKE